MRGELERLKTALRMLDTGLLLEAWGAAVRIADRTRDPDTRRARTVLLDLLSPLREEALRLGLDVGDSLHESILSAGSLAEIRELGFAAITRFATALKTGRTAPRTAIREAVRHVEANLGRAVTLVEAAAVAGMSVSHFEHTFRREMDCSFVSYVSRVKMERARELLLTTDLRVHEVAEAVGFESASYFSMVFRKVVGSSPAEIRARQKH